jgi:hypothetical protein
VRHIAGDEAQFLPSNAGPWFLAPHTWPYRLEMAVGTVVIVLALFGWRGLVVGDLNLGLTIFWFLWPDLAAFIPIGIAAAGGRGWPSWGPTLYNTVHTLLVWLPIFAIWSAIAGGIEWPLLGWAGHITADRAFGYYLRAPVDARPPPPPD